MFTPTTPAVCSASETRAPRALTGPGAALAGIALALSAALALAVLTPPAAPPTRPPAEPREVFKGDRLDRQAALADPVVFARVDPPLASAPAELFPLPVPQPPLAQTTPAADPEPVRRHRRAGGTSLCARHGLRTIWYDNGRRWHCRR